MMCLRISGRKVKQHLAVIHSQWGITIHERNVSAPVYTQRHKKMANDAVEKGRKDLRCQMTNGDAK